MSIFDNLFGSVRVTPTTYNAYINTGKVPMNVLKMIAFKIIKNETLTQQEMVIFTGKTAEINELIRKITNTK
jgi:hypothetical protein